LYLYISEQVLDDNDAAAAILSQLIHCHMLDIDPGFADQLDLDLPVDDLGVWIDPIGRSAGVVLIHRKNMMIVISLFFYPTMLLG